MKTVLFIFAIPLSFILAIISGLESYEKWMIINDKYTPGSFIVQNLDCTNLQNSSSSPKICYALGCVIDHNFDTVQIQMSLKLGLHEEVDFNQSTIPVFYRDSGEFPILNISGNIETELEDYEFEFWINTIVFFVCWPILFYSIKYFKNE